MCGIAGAVALQDGAPRPALETIEAMVGALRHRGPDEFGLYRDARALLGHARLSIIDLATGQQPLCDEDGRTWVVFNGEIFNYLELRRELEALGHAFRTRSDTEVIVHAWEAWGPEAFARFNGQFALALWEPEARRLVLARDRLGVRPLYTCEHAGRLWFASEVKALFAGAPDLPRALDPAGLAETFTFWTVVPPRTVFQGVRELEPGHLRVIAPGEDVDRAFWCPRYPEPGRPGFQGGLGEAAEAVRGALREAVSLRMLRADVPVGCYLSGGLDSTLVAALGREAKGAGFATFSVRFEDAAYDETPWQRLAAAAIGSDHHELLVRRGDVAEALPSVVRHAERPLLRAGPAPLFLLSRLVRESGIKVVLTGEGADELFAGYDLFREGRVRRFWGRRPGSALRPRLLDRLYPWLARTPMAQRALARDFFGRDLAGHGAPGFAHRPRWGAAAALQRLFTPALQEAMRAADPIGALLAGLPEAFPRWAPLAQDQYLEVRTLLSGYLLSAQGDRMLMAHSVEGRFPFLDAGVIELANALPAGFKLLGLDEKHVLKRAARGLVPDGILARPKQPYRAPDALALAGPEAPAWAGDLLGGAATAAAGIFEPQALARLWRKCRAGGAAPFSNADDMAVVGALTTGLLHEAFIRTAPSPGRPVPWNTVVDRLAAPGRAASAAPLEVT
ncbi:MAG: asparagine synthase (glutamine-hydrolyzing) [Anaeromyxobacteraceae bacterium]|nr:asparagine synthase (glutamine-hydrolyzing) [Anaeromyxobacteraceae bacterium]